jgi:hypothetical protein
MFFNNNRLHIVGDYLDNNSFNRIIGRSFSSDINLNAIDYKKIGDTTNYINSAKYVYRENANSLFILGAINDTSVNAKTTISKIDTNNAISWQIQFTDSFMGSTILNNLWKIEKDYDSNYFAVGDSKMGIGGLDGVSQAKSWIVKFNSSGNIIYDRKIIDSTYATCGILGNDSSLILGGTKGKENGSFNYCKNVPFIAKYSSINDSLIWKYLIEDEATGLYSLSQTRDIIKANGNSNGYVLISNHKDTCQSFDLYSKLTRIDENGTKLWSKNFRGRTIFQIYFDSTSGANNSIHWHQSTTLSKLYSTQDGGYVLVGSEARFPNLGLSDTLYGITPYVYGYTILIKTNCNGDTASPKASMNILVDPATPNQMTVYNLSQFYDTCVFSFNDGSADVILTMYDTAHSFTHAFAPGTAVTCIAKACNQEWDTLHYTQIITSNALLQKNEMGMIGEVYPNPANTQVSLNYFLGEASQGLVSVSSTTGHVLYQEKVNTSTGTLHINTSNLSNGMYLLKVQSNNGASAMKKLMILH